MVSPEPDQVLPISRRRWRRMSIRGLIFVVIAVAAGLGWVVRCARTQREAVAAIERAGGYVRYYSERTDDTGWWRRWLSFCVSQLGVDHRDYIENVYSARVWNDEALEQAGRLSGLVELDAARSCISDGGLVQLAGLTNLAFLDLEATQVSDTGLAQLKALTSLSALDLRGTRVTDAGLEHLTELTKLELLMIDLAWRGPVDGPAQVDGPAEPSNFRRYEPTITATGIKRLEQALPSLTVQHSHSVLVRSARERTFANLSPPAR
jgi:hypothetical protein